MTQETDTPLATPPGPANSELDGLAGLAAQADQVAMGADNPTADQVAMATPTGPDYGQEAAGTVDTIAALITGYAPAAESLWNPAAKQRIAAALAPVMEKYGFTLSALPPEVVLAVMAGPVLYKSAKIVAEQMRAERAAAPVAAPAAAPAGAAPGATPGPTAPVHEQTKLYPMM